MKSMLTRLLDRETLTSTETKEILLKITEEKTSYEQIAALLAIFQMRGITAQELIGFKEALLQHSLPVNLDEYNPLDIVGTGGDEKNTFNISTCACFVVAGAGYKVAKHGNYGATSISGASNVMEEHGVKFTADNDVLKKSIEESNMAYLHAQLFNPAMKYVGPVRKALQIRTIFNLLGPLVNPSRPKYQLLGVADLSQMRLYTEVFRLTNVGFTIVNSLDGYDEISLTSPFRISSANYESMMTPEDIGFGRVKPEDIFAGETKQEAAAVFRSVLEDCSSKSQKDCVMVNAAFGIQTIEPSKSIEECLAMARESLESGKALSCFKKFVEINS
jgi:anthranilate phosphoribosyltransferase